MPLKPIYWVAIVLTLILVVGLWAGAFLVYRSLSVKRSATSNAEFKTGDTIKVGYMAYTVYGARYATSISNNEFINESPNANFLLVDVGVQNLDREERMVPTFNLIDENGAEYGVSDKAWMADNALSIIENLNPDVRTRGFLVFDVPKTHRYKLRVGGGYWSAQEALIDLGVIK